MDSFVPNSGVIASPSRELQSTPSPFVERRATSATRTPEVLESNNSVQVDIWSCFTNYLKGCDGGGKEEKHAVLISGRVRKIVQEICGNGSMQTIFNRSKLRDFINDKVNSSWKVSTLKTYSIYLSTYFKFLRSEEIIPCSKDEIECRLNDLSLWGKSHRRKSNFQKLAKKKMDQKRLLIPGTKENFLQCKIACRAVRLLGEAQEGTTMTRTDFCIVRNYILTRIFLRLGVRTGVAAELTMEAFNSGEKTTIKGVDLYDFNISNHKTAALYDDAILIVDQNVYMYMTVFKDYIRPCCKPVTSHFFTSWSGEAMSSSGINLQVKHMWKQAGFGDICITTFRKTMSTAMANSTSKDAKRLCSIALDHTEETAKNHYYVLKDKKDACRRAFVQYIEEEKNNQTGNVVIKANQVSFIFLLFIK